MRGIETKEGNDETTDLMEIFAYDTSLYSPLLGEIEKGTPEIVAMLYASAAGGEEMSVKFFTRLVHKATRMEIPVQISGRRTNATLVFTIPTAELQSGRYYLYIFAEDQITKAKASVNTTFVVN
jgi:hypothetical protein